MTVLARLGLNQDPFSQVPTPQVLAALSELDYHIEARTPLIVLFGPPGTGKTFLLNFIKEDRRASGLSVRYLECGDFLNDKLDQVPDLLLIDEADAVTETVLSGLLQGHRKRPASIVLAVGLMPRGHLVGFVGPALVELKPQTVAQARMFVEQRARAAGRPDLFSPEALNTIAETSAGSHRLLRSIGRTALYLAAHEGAARVEEHHARESSALRLVAPRPLPVEVSIQRQRDMFQPVASAAVSQPKHGQLVVLNDTYDVTLSRRAVLARTEPATRRIDASLKLAATLALGIAVFAFMLLSSRANEAESVERHAEPNWERVAQATLPPPIILAVLNPVPLKTLPIATQEAGVRPARNGPAPKAPRVQAMNQAKDRGSARHAIPPLAGMPREIRPKALAIQSQGSPPLEADNQPAPPSQPASLASARLERRMSSAEISAALLDLSARAGLNPNREYPAFRTCVFKQIPPEAVPSVQFWTVATLCLK